MPPITAADNVAARWTTSHHRRPDVAELQQVLARLAPRRQRLVTYLRLEEVKHPHSRWPRPLRPRPAHAAPATGTIARDRGLSILGARTRPGWEPPTVQGGPDMRKAFVRTALLAALAVTLAACGGNDDAGSGTAATAAPTTAAAQETNGATVAVASSKLGDILVDADGRTLYVFTKDKGDQSACSGECAANWPALTGTATAGTGAQASMLSASMQANGESQVTYAGKPLYYFAADAKPGDTNGQGVGGVWFAVTADGELVKAAGSYP